MTAYVPRFSTSNAKAEGRFGKQDFVYNADEDVYVCPNGERLAYRFTSEEDGKVMRCYSTTACSACPLKEQCTTGKERRVKRWEHEAVLDAAQERLDKNPDMMTVRRSTVEHPFGTLKFWMGSAHFLMKKLHNVKTEMSLHVLAYNMKRVMKILGVPGLLRVMQAWRLICHFLLVLACTVRSNSPDRFLNRSRAILTCHREIRAYASTSLRRGLANPGETNFSHSLGLRATSLSISNVSWELLRDKHLRRPHHRRWPGRSASGGTA